MDRLAAALDGLAGSAGPASPSDPDRADEPHEDELHELPHPPEIGGYRILGVLGEGGMGVVYRAEQQHPRRLVALKVIRPLVGGRGVLRRFRQESETLGRLEHPGIARIYEAGTARVGAGSSGSSGGVQPFFAMELVQGRPLQEYADAHRLDVAGRLDLLARVCDAVQYAHQKGVIHRDLKPANILVTDDGQPKVLDFGVARVVDADGTGATGVAAVTAQTQTGQIVGTLRYMSPEQAEGRAHEVDTRSDVYALGVIGYELLTGRPPYDLDGRPVGEVLRVIRESEPSRLSTINRGLRGDVETILLKALEKDKARRYASAADLGTDIRRFLNYEPIAARPPSTWYQLSRFARRNKVLVGGVAATFLALTAGAVTATVFAVRSGNNARLADQNARAATQNERDARANAVKAQRQLAEALIAGGFRDLDAGDPSLALLQFVKDLRIEEVDAPDAARARAARYRVGMALHWVPRPLDVAGPLPEVVVASGNQVVVSDGPAALCVREAGTGRAVSRIDAGGPVSAVARSPDGRRVAAVVAGEIRIWDAATGRLDAKPIPTGFTEDYYVRLDFSPDGRRVAALGDGVGVWDIETGAPVVGIISHPRSMDVFAFSPDGRWLATGANDATVRFWDLDSGQPIWAVDDKGKPVLDAKTHQPERTKWRPAFMLKHPSGYVYRLAFGRDGRRLMTATSPDHAAWVWDVGDGGRRAAGPLVHDVDPASLTLSPDGSRAVTATEDGVVRVWDADTGRPLSGAMRHTAAIQDLRFEPGDPRVVLTTHYGPPPDESPVALRTRAWDAAADPCTLVLRHSEQVSLGSFSPDGRHILTGGRDSMARMWDAQTGRETVMPMQFGLWNFKNEPVTGQFVGDAVFSPDGRRVALAAAHSVMVFDAATAKPLSRLPKPIADDTGLLPTVSFSPDGRWLVSSAPTEKEAWVWDPETGAITGAPLAHDGPCLGAWVSPDGRVIATATAGPVGARIHLWDAATRRRLTRAPVGPATRMFRPCFEARTAVAFSPDGRLLATAATVPADFPTPAFPGGATATAPATAPAPAPRFGPRALVQVWDARTGRLAAPPIELDMDSKGEWTAEVAFSPDGGRLVCAVGAVAWVLDVATGRPVTRPLAHRGTVWGAAFSPDGRLVATASDDTTGRVWNAATGLPVSPPLAHRKAVYHVAFSPDGRRLLTCSGDGTARVWDVAPDERPLADLQRLAELLAGRRLDDAGAVSALPAAQWDRTWDELRRQYPQQFRPPPALPPVPGEPLPAYVRGLDAMYQHWFAQWHLAWDEVYAGHGAEAVAAAERSRSVWVKQQKGPGPPYQPTELALAVGYLLTGRFDDAEPILLAHRGEVYNKEPRTFGQAAMDTIEDLRRLGITNPDLDRAEQFLHTPPPAPPTTRPAAPLASRPATAPARP